MRRLNSLRSQFIAVLVGLTVLLMAIMGTMNIITVSKYSSQLANMELNWQTQHTAYQIQKLLIQTADITHSVSNVLTTHVTAASQISDPYSRKTVKTILEHRFLDFANHTPGISGYYVHFADDLTGTPDGFHFIYNSQEDMFFKENDQIFRKEDDLIVHGWNMAYNQAQLKGTAIWMPPHPNDDTGVMVISYVEPVYVDDQFVAIVGVDIELNTLVNMLQQYTTASYKGSKVFLFSNDGLIYYHPDYPQGAQTTLKDLGLEHYSNILQEQDSDDQVLPFTYEGEQAELSFVSLENGINLGITAPNREIYKDRDITVLRTVLLLIGLIVLTIVLALWLSNWIVLPLKKISDAATRVGKGDYDTPLTIDRLDEIGNLATNIDITRQRLKLLVGRLRTDAFQDKLTGLYNATAFQARKIEMDAQIHKHEPLSFGLVMLDVNGLKSINDTYGHERGNLTLQASSQAMCDVYQHSLIYRVGGDEFCIIVQGEDLKHWDECWQKLQPCLRCRKLSGPAPWNQVAIAAGHTRYDPKKDTNFVQVFNRADDLMYQNKRNIKGNTMR